MDIPVLTAAVGACGTLIGLLINASVFARNRDKDVRATATEQATINAKLDIINVTSSKTSVDVERVSDKVNTFTQDFGKEMARMDESIKVAHKRIDKIEGNE